MPQPLIELGGQPGGPILHLAVANGFVPETYLPLLRPFMSQYRAVSAVPRALWGDQAPPPLADAPTWQHIADDLLAALECYRLEQVVAIGHSFGGIASMNAVIAQPWRFRALVLLDPTILDEQIVDAIAQAMQLGISDQHPLAQSALKRKRHFESAEAFYARYRDNRVFADWDDEALRLYAEHGTVPAPEGGVTLRFSAEWEAFYFSTGFPQTWQALPKLNGLVPTLIVRGTHSDTYTAESAEKVARLVPAATHATVPGGHLFPHSAPRQTGRLIADWLRGQGLPAPAE
jgi:pimeloyl-ACP methyl ester carboxylesterase